MRIISGCRRGRKLHAPEGFSTRPTSDRVKESLFNILAAQIDFRGVKVLDICAGSGSLGLEALSRGAESCIFLESDRGVAAVLQKNITAASLSEKSSIVTLDAVKWLNRIQMPDYSFGVVFFDPPYDAAKLYSDVLTFFGSFNLLDPDGLIVAECRSSTLLNEVYGTIRRVDRRVYGDTAIDFFGMGVL